MRRRRCFFYYAASARNAAGSLPPAHDNKSTDVFRISVFPYVGPMAVWGLWLLLISEKRLRGSRQQLGES